jgi:hypothetical protein
MFFGKPRKGKTLHGCMNTYYDYKNGRKIYSVVNPYFKLFKFPHTVLTVDDALSISHMKVDRLPKTMYIQEADKIFDSRRSARRENVLLSDITGQSGKRNTDILYDTQFPTRIDKSLRDVTDVSIYCDCEVDERKNPIYFEYYYFDGFMGQYTGKTYKLPAFYMSQFYNLYDTYKPTEHLGDKKS